MLLKIFARFPANQIEDKFYVLLFIFLKRVDASENCLTCGLDLIFHSSRQQTQTQIYCTDTNPLDVTAHQ